ncbi:hypothetical protein [Burkholderia anthina]|uniref:hypothetical protein n=1 Tax=Burkholderia anthina TaxID=179879 RepID=UPI00158D4964|nr:hypothetical protein [Burkholderia anthina]
MRRSCVAALCGVPTVVINEKWRSTMPSCTKATGTTGIDGAAAVWTGKPVVEQSLRVVVDHATGRFAGHAPQQAARHPKRTDGRAARGNDIGCRRSGYARCVTTAASAFIACR